MSPGSPNKREEFRCTAADRARARFVRQGTRTAERVRTPASQGPVSGRPAGGHPDAAARRRARYPQQTQRYRPDGRSPSGAVGALEGRHCPPPRLRSHGPVGGGEAHRRLRPGRRAAAGQELGTGVLGVALQGIAVAERRRASSLRRVAQELRDDVPGGTRRSRGSGQLEQPVEREEIGRRLGHRDECFGQCSGRRSSRRRSGAERD